MRRSQQPAVRPLMGLTFDDRPIYGALADQLPLKLRSVLDTCAEQVR